MCHTTTNNFYAQALLRSELRTANVVALPPKKNKENGASPDRKKDSGPGAAVECLVLDRE